VSELEAQSKGAFSRHMLFGSGVCITTWKRQRAARYDELCTALRAAPAIEVSVDHWKRVTDWQWNLTPLSPASSLNGIGGRFNIGKIWIALAARRFLVCILRA